MIHSKNQKCIWSGKRSPKVKPVTLDTLDRFAQPAQKTVYVLPEYEDELQQFNETFVHQGKTFLFLILTISLLTVIVPLGLLFISGNENLVLAAVGILVSLLGMLVIIFPFTTPETIHWLGIKKSIILMRALGVLTILIGIFIAFHPL